MKELRFVFGEQMPLLVEMAFAQHRSLRRDGIDGFVVLEFYAIRLCIFEFPATGRNFVMAGVDCYITASFSDCRPGHIHCRVSGPYDGDGIAELIDIWILQIIYGEMAVPQTFAADSEQARPPYA